MENSVGTGAHRVNRRHVGNVGFDDLKTLFIAVLLQIRSAANDKTVQHTNPPPSRNQPIDKMAADKASATGHDIKIGQYPLRSPGARRQNVIPASPQRSILLKQIKQQYSRDQFCYCANSIK
jgi:hypothetical protein